jgi:uncharacterized protein
MTFWKFFAPGRKVDFFDLLIQQGEKTHAGCRALVDFLAGKGEPHAVKRFEEECDDVRRILIDELNQTFMTPIDREDIFALSRAIDDVIDYAKNTVQEMEIFGVTPNAHLSTMAQLLAEGAEQLAASLKHLKANPNVAVDYAVRAKRFENAMNKEYLHALNELFSGQELRQILCYREIYRHFNRSADRVDEAANIISNIVMKMV